MKTVTSTLGVVAIVIIAMNAKASESSGAEEVNPRGEETNEEEDDQLGGMCDSGRSKNGVLERSRNNTECVHLHESPVGNISYESTTDATHLHDSTILRIEDLDTNKLGSSSRTSVVRESTMSVSIDYKLAPTTIHSASFEEDSTYTTLRSLPEEQQQKKPEESKTDYSRATNNIPPGGKSTKAFYEIKPSVRSEMVEPTRSSTTQTAQTRGRFVLPTAGSVLGRFSPFFEDDEINSNVTVRIGNTVLLDCKVGLLADKVVTWLQQREDSFRLLTFGKMPYSNDQRISLNFRYPNNWRLQILYATPTDSGLYKCQVTTHPPLVKKINVIVTAPKLTITDDFDRIVTKERHLKAGSALTLKCEARDIYESHNESVLWTKGDETLLDDVSENRTTETSARGEILVIVSTLIVERASPRHAGNYSCVVPGKAKTTITVHVLNGELPAAVHDGNGVSRAVLNLWLIHLTVSYVFSR